MEYLKERKEGGNEHTEKNGSGGGLDPQYYQQKKHLDVKQSWTVRKSFIFYLQYLCESDLLPGVEPETKVHVALLFLDIMGLFVLCLAKIVQISFISQTVMILMPITL